jgi:hypothetical protein
MQEVTAMGTAKKNTVKCVRDMCDFPPACYRLASDGRKWRQLCEDRQKLATWLAIKADGDGTRIFPGIKKMMNAMGWSRRKTCYVLHALQVVGCVVRESEDGKKLKTSEHGTARRKFNLEPLLRANEALQHGSEFTHAGVAEVQDSPEPECKIGVSEVQDSIPEVQDWGSQSARFDSQSASLRCTQPTPNRHQPTPTTQAAGVGKDLIGENSAALLSTSIEDSLAAHKNISHPPIIPQKGSISVSVRTPGEIIAEFNLAMVEHTGRPLNANESHRKAAVEFYRKHGSQVAIAAWAVYLMNSPDKIKRAEGKEENRAWRLHDFFANGDAQIYAERVRPCIERGLTSHAVIEAFGGRLKEWDELAKDEPALVEDAVQVLNQFQRDELSSMFTAYRTQKSNYRPGFKGLFEFLTTTHVQAAQVS